MLSVGLIRGKVDYGPASCLNSQGSLEGSKEIRVEVDGVSIPESVAAVFAAYPDDKRVRLLELRCIILDSAQRLFGPSSLTETLKWGEPSYRPLAKHGGTTVRLHWKPKFGERVGLFVHCQTTLIADMRASMATSSHLRETGVCGCPRKGIIRVMRWRTLWLRHSGTGRSRHNGSGFRVETCDLAETVEIYSITPPLKTCQVFLKEANSVACFRFLILHTALPDVF